MFSKVLAEIAKKKFPAGSGAGGMIIDRSLNKDKKCSIGRAVC